MTARYYLLLASFFGFTGVGMGAVGTHAFRQLLETNNRLATYDTATQYHIYHALALLGVALLVSHNTHRWVRWAGHLFTLGIVLFSGSLYILAFTNASMMGAVAPMGGFAFLAGWACIGLYAWSQKPNTLAS